MNDNILISIITPSFNSEDTIERTINSVLNQTYSRIEYIIVDGGSTDSTLQIIEKYKKLFYDRNLLFKFISEPDNGISDAFNKGVCLSTGSYVAIINSDDWLEVETIQRVVNSISEEYSIYCGDIKLYVNGVFDRVRKSKPNKIKWGMYIMHPTMIVKRELYNLYKYDNSLKIAMDYDWTLNILSDKGIKIKYIPKVLANMELGGISSNVHAMKKEEHVVINRYFSMLHILLFILREDLLSLTGHVVSFITKNITKKDY